MSVLSHHHHKLATFNPLLADHSADEQKENGLWAARVVRENTKIWTIFMGSWQLLQLLFLLP